MGCRKWAAVLPLLGKKVCSVTGSPPALERRTMEAGGGVARNGEGKYTWYIGVGGMWNVECGKPVEGDQIPGVVDPTARGRAVSPDPLSPVAFIK